jgi:hypothetical protein
MKNYYLPFLLATIILISSCQTSTRQSEIEVIEVDVESTAEMKLSEFFTDFQMVRLETSDDVLIGEIRRIKQANGKIYVSDGHGLYIFDQSGKCLSSINKKGQGPGEYSGLQDFAVDGENIVIWSNAARKLLVYRESGEFVSEYKLTHWALVMSPPIDHNYLLYSGNQIGDGNNYKLHVINNEGETDIKFLQIDAVKSKYLHIIQEYNFTKYKDKLRFFEAYNDTIYTITKDKIEPAFYVDFKGKNIPQSFFDRGFENLMKFMQSFSQQDYAVGVSFFAENEQAKMFCSYYQNKGKLTVFDAQKKTSQTFSSIQDDVFFNSLKLNVDEFRYFAGENIVFPVDAATFVDWRENHQVSEKYKDIIETVKDDDNPVLFIFKLK